MLTPITDTYGNLLHPGFTHEEHPGSIVMTDGEWGTAWQRHFSTGRWHPTRGGGSKSWAELLARRNLVLVYSAPPREDGARVDRPLSAGRLGLSPVEQTVRTWATGRGN
jgi:hypothetical protein